MIPFDLIFKHKHTCIPQIFVVNWKSLKARQALDLILYSRVLVVTLFHMCLYPLLMGVWANRVGVWGVSNPLPFLNKKKRLMKVQKLLLAKFLS